MKGRRVLYFKRQGAMTDNVLKEGSWITRRDKIVASTYMYTLQLCIIVRKQVVRQFSMVLLLCKVKFFSSNEEEKTIAIRMWLYSYYNNYKAFNEQVIKQVGLRVKKVNIQFMYFYSPLRLSLHFHLSPPPPSSFVSPFSLPFPSLLSLPLSFFPSSTVYSLFSPLPLSPASYSVSCYCSTWLLSLSKLTPIFTFPLWHSLSLSMTLFYLQLCTPLF